MDAPLKKILRSLSLELRHTLEGSYSEDGIWNAGDLERRLNQIGIWRDRPVKPISEMPNLTSVDRHARELIDAYLALRSEAGISQSDAVAEFIREAAYTWANRLFALRCMEARGIIDPVIFQEESYGGRSMVHNRFAQRNPALCTGEDDGLFAMLSNEFQERSQELPDLFTPNSPAVALRPSVAALKKCIGLLSGTIPANGGKATDEAFTAPDAFGWAYQYWNAEEKDRVFTMVRTKKGAKIEGADIIPATQLYTEPYMVKFLVQNSLGATWMMMHPESKLSTSWEYYVKDADRAPADKKPVAEITFLDPACGSGHFLIEAFDLLFAMYDEEGQSRESAAICHSILNNNLFGIDIDERAVQITKAVLWMKVAETVFARTKKQLIGEGFSEFHDHIIATNIRLPKGKDHLDAFLKKHPEDAPLRPALLTVFDGLQNVHELGSLVQIEEPVEKELKVLKERAKQQRFDPESLEIVEKVNFSRWKQQVMKRLKAHFQDEAEKALPTEAFFSQSAVKGLALFDLLARRYDVVAANPPYMGSHKMGHKILSYIKDHYRGCSRDLYAVFLRRTCELLDKNGISSLVTMHGYLFLSSLEPLREYLLTEKKIQLIAHLGTQAFDALGDHAPAAMICIQNCQSNFKHEIVFFNLTHEYNKEPILRNIPSSIKRKQSTFLKLPACRILYSLPHYVTELFESLDPLENEIDGTIVRRGLDTGAVSRFVRAHWEVRSNIEWVPYCKGGDTRKWYGNSHYIVRWSSTKENRLDFRENAIIPNRHLYFINGVTFSRSSGTGLNARLLQSNTLIGSEGPGILLWPYNVWELLGFLGSRSVEYIASVINPSMHYQTGDIAILPLPTGIKNNGEIGSLGRYCYECARMRDEFNSIIDNAFDLNYVNKRIRNEKSLKSIIRLLEDINEGTAAIQHSLEADLDEIAFNLYNISKNDAIGLISGMGISPGWYPVITNYDIFPQFVTEDLRIPKNLNNYSNLKKISLTSKEFTALRNKLQEIYETGPGVKRELEEAESISDNDDEDISSIASRISIPAETFLEELSQKMEIHPLSIYWLLKEGIEKEGWRCIPEEKRYTEDLFTVMVLRLMGHRWPKQIDAGEPVPNWTDPDGIIPITSGLTHPTLLQQVRDRIAAEFPGGKVHEIENEFEGVVGMSLERWLTGEFFKHHISQFKKRPIAWQLSSSPLGAAGRKGKGRGSRREPAFFCLVYYHKIDADILHKIKTQYVGDLINRYGTELRALEGREKLTGDQATRKVQLDNWIAELNDFSKALQDVADAGFESTVLKEIVKKEPLDKWTSRDGKAPHPKSADEFHAQEKRYDPDINDGVRVNIVPLQKAGLLAADVIAKKDVEKAIADRAEWRADERRWCREGKLPKCGWWE